MEKLFMNLSKTQNIISFCEQINTELRKLKLVKHLGGYLTIVERNTGTVVLTILIGTVPFERTAKCRRLSIEKAKRVFDDKLSSSFQNRNPEQSKWSGAISGKEYIYSFSGHTEEVDEAISILLCAENEKYLNPEFVVNSRFGENPKPINLILINLSYSDLMPLKSAHGFIYAEIHNKF